MDVTTTLGFWSILPPVVAIGLALWTRQVFLALGVGIWFGYLILSGGHPLVGTLAAIDAMITVLTDAGNARLVVFTLIMGSLDCPHSALWRGGRVYSKNPEIPHPCWHETS